MKQQSERPDAGDNCCVTSIPTSLLPVELNVPINILTVQEAIFFAYTYNDNKQYNNNYNNGLSLFYQSI